MNPRREGLRRLPATAVAPLVAAVVISGSAVAAEVNPDPVAEATVGFEPTRIEVGADVAGVTIEIPQVERAIDGVESLEVDLPADRPSLLVGVDQDHDIDALALASGDGEVVRLSSRSTAATLVALSPGVLTGDDTWLGIVGHLVATPAFEELVAVVTRVADLRDPAVRRALEAVLVAAGPEAATDCGWVCAERSAEDAGRLFVENASLGRLVVLAEDGTVCGVAAGAERAPARGASEVALLALAGQPPSGHDTLDALRTEPALTSIQLDAGDEGNRRPCRGELRILGPGDGIGLGPALALVSSRLEDFADPLLDFLSSGVDATDPTELDEDATELAGRGVVATLAAVGHVEQRRGVVPGGPESLAARLVELTGDGLLTSQLPAVGVDIAAPGSAPTTSTSTSSTTSSSTTIPPPTPLPVATTPPADAPPATAAPVVATTTAPPTVVIPAPPPTIGTTTTSPAPTTTAGLMAVSMSTSFAPPPASGQWSISVTVNNTGTRSVDLATTRWSMTDQATGAAVTIVSVTGVASGILAAGAASTGTVVAQVGGGGPYQLVWDLGGGVRAAAVIG